jgi:hypothetical protein
MVGELSEKAIKIKAISKKRQYLFPVIEIQGDTHFKERCAS